MLGREQAHHAMHYPVSVIPQSFVHYDDDDDDDERMNFNVA